MSRRLGHGRPPSQHPRDALRAELQRKFNTLDQLRAVAELPPRGWVHTMRTALGMSAEALAFRMNVSKRAVQSLEAGEVSGRAQLATLRQAADALNCELLHVLVPRQSLDAFIDDNARDLAIRTLGGFDLTNTKRLDTITDSDLATLIADLKKQPRRIGRSNCRLARRPGGGYPVRPVTSVTYGTSHV